MSRIFTMAMGMAVFVFAVLATPAAALAAAPGNDDFAAAAQLVGPAGSISGSTLEATLEAGEPLDHSVSPSVWYRWTSAATVATPVTFDICTSDFNNALDVYTGDAFATLQTVTFGEDECALQASVGFLAQPGVNYVLRVGGGVDGAAGTFTLTFPAGRAPGTNAPDTTAPVLDAPPRVAAEATSATGAVVTWNATARDDRDGTVAVSCSRASGSTFALGTTTVTCSARDAAGNSTSSSFPVTVAFAWSGFLAPVRSGMTWLRPVPLPIRFRLAGASSRVTNAVARISVARLSGTTETPVALDPRLPNRFTWVALDSSYWYILPTQSLTRATYRIRVDLGDGVQRSFDIVLR